MFFWGVEGDSMVFELDFMGYEWDLIIKSCGFIGVNHPKAMRLLLQKQWFYNICESTLETQGFHIEHVDCHRPRQKQFNHHTVVLKGINQFKGIDWIQLGITIKIMIYRLGLGYNADTLGNNMVGTNIQNVNLHMTPYVYHIQIYIYIHIHILCM